MSQKSIDQGIWTKKAGYGSCRPQTKKEGQENEFQSILVGMRVECFPLFIIDLSECSPRNQAGTHENRCDWRCRVYRVQSG